LPGVDRHLRVNETRPGQQLHPRPFAVRRGSTSSIRTSNNASTTAPGGPIREVEIGVPGHGLGSHLQRQRMPSAEMPDAGRAVGGKPTPGNQRRRW
jgi:hypothetical protein